MTDYFIVNLSHAKLGDTYVALWRPHCSGYAWPLCWAGRYPEAEVRAQLDYFNHGDNIAVPCQVVEALAVPPPPGAVDGDAGPVVPATRENWDALLAAVIAPPAHPLHRAPKRLGPMLFTDAPPAGRAAKPRGNA